MSSTPPPPPPPPGNFPPAPPPGYQSYGAGAPTANYASFGQRLGAYIVDGLVGLLFMIPGIIVVIGTHNAAGVILYVVGGIAFLVMYCKKVAEGGSWGQKMIGIRIVDAATGENISAGRAFGRRIASLVSGWICYLGFLWMLWDANKQTWHDKMLNTKVVRT